ncbi:MAG: molybdopterin converting factor subunit 1 [Phycisphaeraceae bacterium]|nr:molybdopterin converting factor subunit 1 [Phycisphaeraceae bacterium]
MTIRVLMFAVLATKTGQREASLDLPEGSRVRDALHAIESQHPALREFSGRLAPAVNQAYVGADHVLTHGDELALIPPVSGG